MTVTREINTTAKKFFDLLIISVKHDIKQATGNDVETENLKAGYTYEKNLTNKIGGESKVKATLINVEQPLFYEAEFLSRRGKNTVQYKIEEINQNRIQVTYSESYDPADKISGTNYKIVSFFYKRSSKKRMNMLLKQMAMYLEAN